MHPTISHQLAVQNQQRLLDQAAADRLARLAVASRPSLVSRLRAVLRRQRRVGVRHPEPRTARAGQA